MNLADRIRGGLWGVLVADAMGVPHEFKTASQIPGHLAMVMPTSYEKTYDDVPYGTWSDDGALTLAFADALASTGAFNVGTIAQHMIDWRMDAHYTPDGRVFDVGITTQNALDQLAYGHAKLGSSGSSDERSNGNGSLMRTLPLALFHTGTDQQLFSDAAEASAITHAHPWSMAACGLYCIAARRILLGEAKGNALAEAWEIARPFSSWVREMPIPEPPTGSGFVLDSLSYAMDALTLPTYESAVLGAIRLGSDTDTTAAIAGGLVGVRDGKGAIPTEWLGALRGRAIAHDIIERLIEARGA